MKKLPLIAIFFTLASAAFAQNLKIVNAASLSTVSVAPNSIISIMGTKLSTGVASAKDPSNPPLSLGGVSVTIGGTAAALFYVAPTQINALVAPTTPLGSQSVVVTSGSTTQTGTVTIASNAPPGLFSLSGSGMRDGAILNAVSFSFSDFSPESNGGPTYLALFGTGISLSVAPTVTVGGLPAQVLFYGAAPCCLGLEQVNIILPASTAGSGRVPVVLTSNAQMSNTVQVVVLPHKGEGAFPDDGENQTRSRELATLAYVPGTSLVLSTDENDDVVRVIDVVAKKVTQVITLPEGSGPAAIAVNAVGTVAVVAESDLGKVAILDLTKTPFAVVTEVATDLSPMSVAISGTQAVVVNQEADNISVINLTSNLLQKTISVGHGPAAVAADTNVKQAYVVNEADGTLSIVDLTALAVTKTLPLGEATRGEGIAVIPGAGIAFVTVPAAGPAGLVLVVNLSSGAITSFNANPERSGGSTAVAYNASKLYLANQTGASVSAVPVNPATGVMTGAIVTVKVDLGARALAIDTKDNLLVVSNEGSGTLVLVDLNTNQVTAHIDAVQASSAEGDTGDDDHSDRKAAKNVPIMSTLSPLSAKAGTTFTLTITGKNLTGASNVIFSLLVKNGNGNGNGDGHGKLKSSQPDTAIAATNVKVSADGTQLTTSVSIAASAQVGARGVSVTTPNGESVEAGSSAALSFTVTP
jgi:uncharacterized protein (TIGR03437 family)